MAYGYEAGETCNRKNCLGVIELCEVENGCSCHINPPCPVCSNPREFCPECGYERIDDFGFNDYIVNIDRKTSVHRYAERRILDTTKIDWYSKSHTHFSMIMEGVYPEGTTKEDVLKLVEGTFGGRFKYFQDGKFEYIAYTD